MTLRKAEYPADSTTHRADGEQERWLDDVGQRNHLAARQRQAHLRVAARGCQLYKSNLLCLISAMP
eukprot:566175-Pleurochrysis_carterae.AAC.1